MNAFTVPRQPALYQKIGGEAVVRRFVDRLYFWMEILPEAHEVWLMHPANMAEIKARLCAFLSTWWGGEDIYRQHYGEPFMRRRHMPFAIDPEARDAWLLCARKALDEVMIEPEDRQLVYQTLATMAEHMRNREPGGVPSQHQCGCSCHT